HRRAPCGLGRAFRPGSRAGRPPSVLPLGSWRSSFNYDGVPGESPELGVQALGVVPEDVLLELFRDRRAFDLPVLRGEIAPGDIRAEQEAVAADPALLDLAQQPG